MQRPDLLVNDYINGKTINYISKKYNKPYGVVKRLLMLSNTPLRKPWQRHTQQDENQIVNLYVNEKKSMTYISNEFNIGAANVKNILEKNNVKVRNLSESQKIREHELVVGDKLPTKDIVKKYVDEKMSLREISDICKCSPATVKNVLNKNNVKTKNAIESASSRLNREFWSKIPEQEIINKYVKEKYSINQIIDEYEISKKAVYSLFKRNNLKTRTPLEALETRKRWYKPYTLPSGKIIKIQGYEPQFLDYVFENDIWKEEDFDFKPKRIKYKTSDGAQHYYFPDFHIPKDNLIIECKSSYVLKKQTPEIQQLKEEATIKEGYKYCFILDNCFKTINN